MRRLVLGTAGHIDHGKTALVRALTGTDTDRLPEEKRRGITIDLGFARLVTEDGTEIGIVDVPGHEAFVRNMVAGATGIDMVLLVIAADEGVMPQTREHLAIIELLGITRGVVAITKADLAEPDWLELVTDEVRELIAATSLAGASLLPVSVRNGAGLDTLVAAIADAGRGAPPRAFDDLFRMPIDRVFTVRGTGTVVTGTVWSGRLQRDESVRIEPAGLTARVRSLQHHGADTDSIGAGERAAIALTGIDRHALQRGDTVLTGGAWAATMLLTAAVRTVEQAPPLRARQRVRVHVGTAEVLARVALLDPEPDPDDVAHVQLRLEAPLVARAGDRLVIRSYSPVHTIAGGTVLEPVPRRRKRLSAAQRTALRSVCHPVHGPRAALRMAAPVQAIDPAALPVLTGLPPAVATAAVAADESLLLAGNLVLDAHEVSDVATRIVQVVADFHAAHPLEDGAERDAVRRDIAPERHLVFDVALARLTRDGHIVPRGGALARPGFEPQPGAADAAVLDRIVAAFRAAGLQAPTLEELPRDLIADPRTTPLIRLLERRGDLVRTGAGRWVHAPALLECVSGIQTQLPIGQPLDMAAFRDLLGLSRKHLIPLLEHLDRLGVTVRRGDRREVRPVGEWGSGARGN